MQTLVREEDIEISPDRLAEAIQDVRAIMEEYLRQESKIVQEVRDVMHERQITYDKFGKVKSQLCEERGHPSGDDGIRWMVGQMLEAFMITANVEEVYSEDFVMRRKVMAVFRRHLIDEAELDREARQRIKNVREGTAEWEMEYRKVLDEIKRKRGLESA
jgi:hypothetical protein